MQASRSFKDLVVWQKAHQFVLKVYSYSQKFPKEEMFGLTSQFRRAAVSIAANISEGFAKRSKADKVRIFNIAQGSLEECRYYIILSHDLGYGETEELNSLSREVSKLLNSYMNAIEKSK
jgi:four helix bundle protein